MRQSSVRPGLALPSRVMFRWREMDWDRLNGLAGRYTKIAALAQDGMSSAKMPEGLSAKQFLRVPIGDSESVLFWRSGGSWNYDGPAELLPKRRSSCKYGVPIPSGCRWPD